MQNVLLVGCSFLSNVSKTPVNTKKYQVFSSSAASNQSIAARAIHQLSQYTYDHVVVLWSGVNRISMPVPIALARTYKYSFRDTVGNTTWFHSGGIGCSGQQSDTPKEIKTYFDTQYLGANSAYLSESTLFSIMSTQHLLEKQGTSYQMGFIYDVDRTTPDREDVSHGFLDRRSPIASHINWDKFTKITPYEWARSNYLLDPDDYHPSTTGMIEWFKTALNIDLTK